MISHTIPPLKIYEISPRNRKKEKMEEYKNGRDKEE